MIAWFILFVLTVVGPPLGFGPPLYRGSHAENGILFVRTHPRTTPYAKATEAHEVVEWWCAWVSGCLLALPVGLALTYYTQAGLTITDATDFWPFFWVNTAVLVAGFLGNALARKATTHFDYVGHYVGLHLKARDGAICSWPSEIQRMINHGDQRGMSYIEVDRKLRQWEPVSKFAMWVFAHRYGPRI